MIIKNNDKLCIKIYIVGNVLMIIYGKNKSQKEINEIINSKEFKDFIIDISSNHDKDEDLEPYINHEDHIVRYCLASQCYALDRLKKYNVSSVRNRAL